MSTKSKAETILLRKIVAFLYNKTDLLWYFTGPDAYLSVLAKSAHPYMLSVAKKKAFVMGSKSGIPDICICDPPPGLEGCHGAYIELKCNKNGLSKEQKDWAKELRSRGYHVGLVKDSLNNFKHHLLGLGYSFRGMEDLTPSSKGTSSKGASSS